MHTLTTTLQIRLLSINLDLFPSAPATNLPFIVFLSNCLCHYFSTAEGKREVPTASLSFLRAATTKSLFLGAGANLTARSSLR